MKPISIEIKKSEGRYYIDLPDAIIEMMGWSEGDFVLIPFHKIDRKEEYERRQELQPKYKDEIQVNIGEESKTITRDQVLELLEHPTPDMLNYRTAYIEYDGMKFGSKAVFKRLLGHGNFNTVTAEHYLNQLGFPAKRTYE